jgi:hypothetical protein
MTAALRGAGDLARRAGTHAGAWALKRPGTPQGQQNCHRADEWDNAELAELSQIQDFMVDFRLTDEGELDFHAFGERVLDDIWERAYPLLAQSRLSAPTDDAGELTLAGQEAIRKAVRAERQRLRGERKRKLADTELSKSIQRQTDAPAVLVNRYVKQAASELLKKTPTGGRKN